jgi:signal transduction histidine kinase
VSPFEGDDSPLPRPPYERLREQLLAVAATRESGGDPDGAAQLRALLDEWWTEQERWNARVRATLGVHHEINNALVGVRGNAQLMLMNLAGQTPAARERLEVVLRESGRIQEATVRLRELKQVLGGPVSRPHAA